VAGPIKALPTFGATGNIVVNGSFENGNFQNSTDLTGWTVVQNAVASGVAQQMASPRVMERRLWM